MNYLEYKFTKKEYVKYIFLYFMIALLCAYVFKIFECAKLHVFKIFQMKILHIFKVFDK